MHPLAARRPWALIAAMALLAALALAFLIPALTGRSGRSTRFGAGLRVHPGQRGSGAARVRSSTGGSRPALPGGPPASPRLGAIPALLATPRPTGTPVNVSVAASPAAPGAPRDFLGLSFEMRSLPAIAGYASQPRMGAPPPGGDLVALLRSLGPGVLRFGGTSADEQVAWVGGRSATAAGARPPWARVAITPEDLAGLAALARESGWRVLLTVNLGHYNPAAAAQEAAAARVALGASLVGIELGNEPDFYVRKHLRPAGWGIAAYLKQAAAYRAAIEAAAPGTPIAGPDPSTGVPGLGWVRAAARALHPALLTDHYYPLSSCGSRPTIGELLSPTVRRHERELLARMLAAARAAAAPLRVAETNSISCEGRPGVSDTFASALWALDYTAHALAAGVTGVNFHDLLTKPGSYSPLLAPTPATLAAGDLRAQPEWYALLAAAQLSGDRPLRASVTDTAGESALGGSLSASAFRAPGGRLQLVLVDYDPPGTPPLAIRLPRDLGASAGPPHAGRGRGAGGAPGTYTRGSVLRLTAPAPAATAGVRLAGRAVAPDGSWSAPRALPAVYRRGGTLSVQVDPSSAAIVTLYPR
jgi:hypothetical protein